MRYPRASDIELSDAIRRYVTVGEGSVTRYLKLLHGNFLALEEPEHTTFLHALADAAHRITDAELGTLLESEWRSRLTAAWLIGVGHREQFRTRLADLLLPSQLCFSGQGYCLALARFGTDADAKILMAYLDYYLPKTDCQYDQAWALGALLHLDARNNTEHARAYLAPGGPWQQWTTGIKVPNMQPVDFEPICASIDHALAQTATHPRNDD